ncbi:MAG: S41 family peptidase [Lysobacteraceae bacterium]
MHAFRLLLLAVLLASFAARAEDAPPADAQDDAVIERVGIDEIRRFVSVFRAVKQAYVDPIDDATLMRAAIRGLLADLDPHSGYLDAEQARSLDEQSSGAYDGLGLEVVQRPDRSLMVVAPIDDTPAARAGIRPGDVIVEIDGEAITADNADTAIDALRGAPGSTVALTLVREGESEPLKLDLVRETIRVASVRVRLLEPGFGYLRISHFQADTGRETAAKLTQLGKDGALKGLVLDLRSNPGGLLNSAVEAADVFLDSGVIVSTRGRLPYSVAELRARRGDVLGGAPIVALVDAGTASAAEVLAAALQDHRRAVVMGSPTFGKGSVQTVLPLDNGDSLKLTTARYYTPDGGSIQASGLKPDIALAEDLVLRRSGDRPPRLRERDLPGHLDAESTDSDAEGGPAAQEEDYAVREALALLKGIAVFGKRTAPTP